MGVGMRANTIKTHCCFRRWFVISAISVTLPANLPALLLQYVHHFHHSLEGRSETMADITTSSKTPALSQPEAENMEDATTAMFCGALGDSSQFPPPPPPPVAHGQRCPCGCVPAVMSLFEMAELRKQAKLKRLAETKPTRR
jgi:hypothetical protein